NLTVLAGTVGDNCVASLLFKDQESAQKILSSLKQESRYNMVYSTIRKGVFLPFTKRLTM
ncbi:MAG: CHASE sensor domain-containing protein, partial [Waddliaceae bacterium]